MISFIPNRDVPGPLFLSIPQLVGKKTKFALVIKVLLLPISELVEEPKPVLRVGQDQCSVWARSSPPTDLSRLQKFTQKKKKKKKRSLPHPWSIEPLKVWRNEL
jgi:hypothetical protein